MLSEEHNFFPSVSKSPNLVGTAGINSSSKQCIVVAVPVLPLIATKGIDHVWNFKEDENSSTYQLVKILSATYKPYLVGHLNSITNIDEQHEISSRVFKNFQCIPIFSTPDDDLQSAQKFCSKSLWPLLHGISPIDDVVFNFSGWKSYVLLITDYAIQINKLIALETDQILVWVEGYILMLLPHCIRNQCPKSKIIFSLHAPFPHLENFWSSVVREELITGMLGADMLTFHSAAHVNNFISVSQKLLKSEVKTYTGNSTLMYSGRYVQLQVVPPMVNFMRMEQSTSEMISGKDYLLKHVASQKEKVILGIDELSNIGGIEHKLLAFEELLDRGVGAVLIQVIVIPYHTNISEKKLMNKIESMGRQINTRFAGDGYVPLLLLTYHNEVPISDRLYLYKLADCLLITALKDVVLHTPFEYVLYGRGCDMIISDHITTTSSLSGIIQVNPWNVREINKAINSSITKPLSKGGAVHKKNVEYVRSQRIIALRILNDVKTRCETYKGMIGYTTGHGLKSRALMVNDDAKRLVGENLNELVTKYNSEANRLIFIDSDYESWRNSRLLFALNTLGEDQKNTMVVFSALSADKFQSWAQNSQNISFAVENGFYRRLSPSNEWSVLEGFEDENWMKKVLPLLKDFEKSINGSNLVVKTSSIVLHLEPQFASSVYQELCEHIKSDHNDPPLLVELGHQTLVIKPQDITKEVAAKDMLKALLNHGKCPGMGIYIGFPTIDEELCKVLDEAIGTSISADTGVATTSTPNPTKVWNIMVEPKSNGIKHYVRSTSELCQVFQQLHPMELDVISSSSES